MEKIDKRVKYTNEMLADIARQYQTRKQFELQNTPAYKMARRRGLLDQICAHMSVKRKEYSFIDLELLAKTCATRAELSRKHKNAYSYAQKHNLLDQICAHMEAGATISDNDALYIWRAVGHSFNGLPIYKMGVTSSRLDSERIKQVANEANMQADLIILAAVEGKATTLEKELKKLGISPGYRGFNGATEFRAMSLEQLAQALSLIKENMKKSA